MFNLCSRCPPNIFYLRKPYKKTIIKFRKNKSAISFAQELLGCFEARISFSASYLIEARQLAEQRLSYPSKPELGQFLNSSS